MHIGCPYKYMCMGRAHMHIYGQKDSYGMEHN